MIEPMTPSDALGWFFVALVVAPGIAAFLAFKGPPGARAGARAVLLLSWLGNAAATVACLRQASAKPSSGIGNGVFYFVALPVAFFAVLWFGIWRAARRHAWVQSLPPDLRRVEELEDIERALEAAKASLARDEQRLKGAFISGEERERLRENIGLMQVGIRNLEKERAKRLQPVP